MLTTNEFWRHGTLNEKPMTLHHRSEEGIWVETVDGERWLVPWQDNQNPVKAGIRQPTQSARDE